VGFLPASVAVAQPSRAGAAACRFPKTVAGHCFMPLQCGL
jgi:hypothetical protein